MPDIKWMSVKHTFLPISQQFIPIYILGNIPLPPSHVKIDLCITKINISRTLLSETDRANQISCNGNDIFQLPCYKELCIPKHFMYLLL